MTYSKPEITSLQAAVSAIQGGKDNLAHVDARNLRSIPAYEADE